MNRPTLITGTILLSLGLLLVLIGFAIGGSLMDDLEYKEVANDGDFTSPREGTFTYDYIPGSSFETKIEIASRTQRVLVFDLTIEDSDGSPVLTQKSMMTPYTRELDLTSLGTYTITVTFEENVTLMDFSIILWEKTFSESIVGPCCLGLLLPCLGGLLLLVGLIMMIVGLIVGRKKEVMPDPWNEPQDLYPPVQRSQPIDEHGTMSPGILGPPPGSD